MRRLLLFLLLLTAFRLGAQITLHGSIANAPLNSVRQMALESWSNDHWEQAEVVYLNPDNTFSAQLLATVPGQYRLRMWSQSKLWNDFIIADTAMADTALLFVLDYREMTGGPARILGSPANALYYDLLNGQRQLTQLRDSTANSTATQLEAAQTDFNRGCLELAAKHRNTLIGDIALLLYQPQKTDYPGNIAVGKMTSSAFQIAHALEKIPFHHDNVLRHNAFIKSLNRYFNYFGNDTESDQAYIDGVMARRNGNEIVDGFLFRFLLDKMMDAKNDPALSYLLKWYAPDCPDENLQSTSILNLLEALKVCAPGNIAPDLTLSDPAGTSIALGEVCHRHKLTLMLFWRSSCSHCQEFEPKLVAIYQKYHPLGLEVYALSNDKTEEDWRNDLQKHPTPWVNVFIPRERRQEVSRGFPAPSTPTLIALDKDRRVVNRVLSRGNLEAYLDAELGKR